MVGEFGNASRRMAIMATASLAVEFASRAALEEATDGSTTIAAIARMMLRMINNI